MREVDAAVEATREAYGAIRWSPLRERVALCHRCADLIESRTDVLASELAEEHGKPLAEATAEMEIGVYGS